MASAPLFAQQSAYVPSEDENAVVSLAFAPGYSASLQSVTPESAVLDNTELLAAQRRLNVGKGLLIGAGSLTALGGALYGSAWALMGDGCFLPSILSVSGLTCMGASVGLYIAGGIVYSKARKAQRALEVTPTGIALNF